MYKSQKSDKFILRINAEPHNHNTRVSKDISKLKQFVKDSIDGELDIRDNNCDGGAFIFCKGRFIGMIEPVWELV